MIPTRDRTEAETRAETTSIRASRTALVVAVIAATAVVGSTVLNYILTEKVRTEIASQTLAIEQAKLQIAASAQKTTETANQVTLLRLDFDKQNAQSRLELDKQIAALSQRNDSVRTRLDERRTRTDEVRLTTDFTKLSNELRPNVVMKCVMVLQNPSFFRLDCNFKNLGVHPVRVSPPGIWLLGNETQQPISDAIARIENVDGNFLPAGGMGSNTYDIYLTSLGEKLVRPTLRTKVDVSTDQQAIDMTRRLATGYITEKELKSLSMGAFTYNMRLN